MSQHERILARQLSRLSRETRSQARASQAAYRGVELTDGPVRFFDEDGVERLQVGLGGDNGEFVIQEVNAPVPPTPTAPIVSSARGGVAIAWDGTFEDANYPLNIARIEIHASLLAGFIPTDATQVGEFTSTTGGTYFFPSAYVLGEVFVALVAVNNGGLESEKSVEDSATPTEPGESDGSAPATSPAPEVTPGINTLLVKWDPIDNNSPVTYEVHVSTTNAGFVPDGTTLVHTESGTFFVYRPTAGSIYTTTYYFKIIAKDADGAAPASAAGSGTPLQATGPDIQAGSITGDRLAANTITAGEIAADAITTDELAVNAVAAENIQANVITAAKMVAGTITAASGIIADAAITTAKIANLAVDTAQIADGAIQTAKIGDAQITTAKINDLAVTNAKIGALAVDAAKIANLAVTTGKIDDLAVTNGKIADLAVNNAKIANATISGAKIQNATIDTANIADLAVTSAKVTALDATKITTGTLNAARINGLSITGMTITGSTIQTASSGQRIVLSSAGVANQIRFWAGIPSEASYGYIQVDGVEDSYSYVHIAPAVLPGTAGRPILELNAQSAGSGGHEVRVKGGPLRMDAGPIQFRNGTDLSRIDFGSNTVTTGAGGGFTINHNIGFAPHFVMTPQSGSIHLQINTKTATTVTGIARWATGANIGDVVASTNITVNWIAMQ